MQEFHKDFELTQGQIWLNAASEGPLPSVAAKALLEAIQWKLSPHHLTIPKFIEVPTLLKTSIGQLIHVDPKDIILGNSATYGMHLLSNGLSLGPGDQVILMRNDFPTDILPWLYLKDREVDVVQLPSVGPVLTPKEILDAITPKTKVICLPMVHSFSGWAIDVEAIGEIAQERGITFIVNMSQVLGACPIDLSKMPIDAIVCAGYKWLLGPYGTGFCWIKPELRRQLNYTQAYWISLMDEKSLHGDGELAIAANDTARKYDVFGTANFFNFVPWRASIDYLQGININTIQLHNQSLVKMIHQGIDKKAYQILSPQEPDALTPIVVISHHDKAQNKIIYDQLKEQGIHLAMWKNTLRISPHIYNTQADIDQCITLLNQKGVS